MHNERKVHVRFGERAWETDGGNAARAHVLLNRSYSGQRSGRTVQPGFYLSASLITSSRNSSEIAKADAFPR